MTEATLGYNHYKSLLDRFLDRLSECFGNDLVSLVLYGSVARGTAGSNSDIDLLIVIDDAPASYRDRLQPLLPILHQMRTEPEYRAMEVDGVVPVISTLILSRAEADRNRLLYLDMIEDGRILHDRDGFFQGRLRKLSDRLKQLGSKKIRCNGTWYWDLKPGSRLGETVVL